MTVQRDDDYVLPGLPTHQQIRASRVRLYDCSCPGCWDGPTPRRVGHAVMVGAQRQAIFGPPVEYAPRRAVSDSADFPVSLPELLW